MTAESGGPRQPQSQPQNAPQNAPGGPAETDTGSVVRSPSTDPAEGAAVDRTVFSGGNEPAKTPATKTDKTGETTPAKTTAPKPKPVVPSTKASTAWITWCVTAVILVALIVFILQNTARTDVSFLWMDGSAPLGVMLLIAAVGAALITALLGTIRIAQLRRLTQRRTNRPR